jgi:hypothetical protein
MDQLLKKIEEDKIKEKEELKRKEEEEARKKEEELRLQEEARKATHIKEHQVIEQLLNDPVQLEKKRLRDAAIKRKMDAE